jgi:uncharacterized protein (TIGR03066 family)
MRPFITCLALASGLLSAAAAPVPKERAEAEKVVGVWKLVKSSSMSPAGVVVSLEMELTQSGEIILRQSVNDGPVAVCKGQYSVAKFELPYSITYPGGGKKTERLTIKKLTDTEMILVDPDGIQEDFERIKPRKDEPKPEKK